MNVVAPAALEGDSPAAAALRALLQVERLAPPPVVAPHTA